MPQAQVQWVLTLADMRVRETIKMLDWVLSSLDGKLYNSKMPCWTRFFFKPTSYN